MQTRVLRRVGVYRESNGKGVEGIRGPARIHEVTE